MNPLQELNHIAELLHAEAVKGPGTVFAIYTEGVFSVTRCPARDQLHKILATYKVDLLIKGLNTRQWISLMNKIEKAYKTGS